MTATATKRTIPETLTGEVSTNDAELRVWREDADSELSLCILKRLLSLLTRHGWKIGRDDRVHAHYRSISRFHRYGTRNGLELKAEAMGRSLSIKFFQNITKPKNSNGGEYDYERLERMPYLLRLRTIYELAALKKFCLNVGFTDETAPTFKTLDGLLHRVAATRRCHPYRDGKPNFGMACNSIDGDKVELKDGDVRYWRHWDGHLMRGTILYSLNAQWYLICPGNEFFCPQAYELFSWRAGIPRRLHQKGQKKLEKLLKDAVSEWNFERAIVLRDVLRRRYPEAMR